MKESVCSELASKISLGRPYVVVREGPEQNNMIIDSVGEYWALGRVALNRFVIVNSSTSPLARMHIGTKDDAMRDGVLAFEECVYASRMGMRARVDHLDIIEDNWRVFLGEDIIDGDGVIKDADKLALAFPRLKQQLNAVKGASAPANARGTTLQFPPSGFFKHGSDDIQLPGGGFFKEPPFVPAPVEDESSQSDDRN